MSKQNTNSLKVRTEEQWFKYLAVPLNNIAKQSLDFARRCAAYHDEDPDSYVKNMELWFDFDRNTAAHWKKIGNDSRLHQFGGTVKLPHRLRTLYALTQLSDNEFNSFVDEDLLHQKTTIAMITDYRNRIPAPLTVDDILAPPVAPDPDPDPEPSRTHARDDIKEETTPADSVFVDEVGLDIDMMIDELEDPDTEKDRKVEIANELKDRGYSRDPEGSYSMDPRNNPELDAIMLEGDLKHNCRQAGQDFIQAMRDKPDVLKALKRQFHEAKGGDQEVMAILNSIDSAITALTRWEKENTSN